MGSETKLDLRVVFMAGALGSGRRTAGEVLCREGSRGPWVMDSVEHELRERCHAAYRIHDRRTGRAAAALAFEGQLDVPLTIFEGLSPRLAYSRFRGYVEGSSGVRAPGEWLARRVAFLLDLQVRELPPERRCRSLVVVDPERAEDCLGLVRLVGAGSCTLVRMIRQDLVDVSGMQLDGVRTADAWNPGDTVSGLANDLRRKAPHLFLEVVGSSGGIIIP